MKFLKVIAMMLFTSSVFAGNFPISWIAPSEREDGTGLSLSEIGGYNIFYGTATGNYTDSVYVSDFTAMEFVIEDLAPDIYYLVITTIDTEGRESVYSDEVMKDISITLFPPKPVTNLTLSIGIF